MRKWVGLGLGLGVLVCWLSFPSRTEVGQARARVLVCLIGFHFPPDP